MKTRTRNVVCWIEAGFDALDLAGFCQVLSDAGSVWNWRAYRIEVASCAGGLVTSNAQQELQTVALDTCSEPEVVIIGGGEHVGTARLEADPMKRWANSDIEWVGLRAGLLAIVRTGRFKGATVAAGLRLQPRLLAVEPTLQFATKPWHVDGKLWSTANADTTDAALSLVQRHVGNSARRAVETSLGLSTMFSTLHVNLTKPGPAES
jgi:transcriptional regulator GlxA family with amidase domain